MLIRLSEPGMLLDAVTGTLIRIQRHPYPAVGYGRVDQGSRADEAQQVIDALDAILAAQDAVTLDQRINGVTAEGMAIPLEALPHGVVDAR